jgi:transaldolase/glucose-6-phosphate isomerase
MRGADETTRLRDLAGAGHPVVDLVLEDALDLGEIFYTWEFATAVAGAIIGVNAFDQPNVQESKDNTKRLIGELAKNGKLDEGNVVRVGDDAAIAGLLAKVKKGDYVALTEYFAETIDRDAAISGLREMIARELRVATTTGYGPRFLHSTGQLHKGGPDSGVFLQMVASSGSNDLKIPGESITFGQLSRAQALGDFQSLASRNRRAIRVDLGENVDEGLKWLAGAVRNAVSRVKA